MIKRASIIALTAALLLSLAHGASAATANLKSIQVHTGPITFDLNGKPFTPKENQSGFIYQGTTYVPLRTVSVGMNKGIRLDSSKKIIQIVPPTESDEQQNAAYLYEISESGALKKPVLAAKTVKVTPVTYTYKVVNNNKVMEAKQASFIYESRLYVPLRFISESVGVKLQFDKGTLTVRNQSLPAGTQTGTDTAGGTKQTEPNPSTGSTPATGVTTPATGSGTPSTPAAKPTYESLVSATDAKLADLKSNMEIELSALYAKYLLAKTDEERTSLQMQGDAKVIACDIQFAGIMNNLKNQLEQHGYSTSIISDYETKYVKMKWDALASISK